MKLHYLNKPSIQKIRKPLLYMVFGNATIIVLAIFFVTALAVKKTDDAMQEKVISMSTSLNVQMKLNMDSYLSRMETIGAIAFGEEATYKYDATDPENDEYEAVNTEKFITDRLYSLCTMDNFLDYGIVYRDNSTVGKISNGTISLFGDKLFDELDAMAASPRTKDGWAAGYKNNYKRIYYAKRVHDNAVLVLSFYTDELDSVFDNPETLSDMDIRLVNSTYNIIYSNEKDEIGTFLPDEIYSRIKDKSSASVMDDDYLVSVNSCGDEWYVVCSIPTKVILSEKNEMSVYIHMTGLISAIIALLIGTVMSIHLTKPVSQAVMLLDTRANNDQLTGILNKQSFNECTANRLVSSSEPEEHALILLDLDNFKGVNDTLGHAYGDKVLAKTGSILRAEFSSEDFVGRIGGDEFGVLVNSKPDEGTDYTAYVKAKCEALCKAFNSNYTGDDGKYKISASIGVSFYPMDGRNFEELFSASDNALYISKKAGKDTYTFYNSDMSKEVADK